MTEQPTEEPEGTVIAEPELSPEVSSAPPPPPPIEAPPEQESLAEQVAREAHTLPESVGPSDVVPNRPNIRPPVTSEEIAAEGEIVEPPADGEPIAVEHQSAADLIAAADAAQTTEELDAIEAQAEGRVTVLDAVAKAREELGA